MTVRNQPCTTRVHSHSAISRHNPTEAIFFIHSILQPILHPLLLPPQLPLPRSHLSHSNPCWSFWSPSFIPLCWFSCAVSVTTPWRRQCGYWRQAYGGFITPHERPWGRSRMGEGRRNNLANLKLHSPTIEGSCSLCTLSFFLSFPLALFSIRQALFLNLLGPMRTTS